MPQKKHLTRSNRFFIFILVGGMASNGERDEVAMREKVGGGPLADGESPT